MKSHTYNEVDFALYAQSVKYWMNRFGITEWEYEIQHEQLDGDRAANTTYQCKSKLACFVLTKNINYDFCHQSDMNKLALHEVIHLLLADFGYTINETKDFDSNLAIAQEHQVVMRLCNALIPPYEHV